MNQYCDCYCDFSGNCLKIGNNMIERMIVFNSNYPITSYILNKGSGYRWTNDDEMVMFNLPLDNIENCTRKVKSHISNNCALSDDCLLVEVSYIQEKIIVNLQFQVFSQLPFITSRLYINGGGIFNHNTPENIIMPEKDTVDAFSLSSLHMKIEAIELCDVTDKNDTLVKKSKALMRPFRTHTYSGNMFVLNSYLEKEELLIVKEGPTKYGSLNRNSDELKVKTGSSVQLMGSGIDSKSFSNEELIPCYGCTIGTGSEGTLKRLYKKLYARVNKGKEDDKLFIMSNTWGDRNQDKKISEEFVVKEIEMGKHLGVDIIQIDDGWQQGVTGNSVLSNGGVWGRGYYNFNPQFWNVHDRKFPNGFKTVIKNAFKNGLKIGLWFSPDGSNDYANWKKDANVILDIYNKYGVSYFKLDGINIENKAGEINLIRLMKMVVGESQNQVSFNLDITAQVRFGYLYEKQYGTLFVENRYTDSSTYYPHNTLKNLWQLSELFPTRRFQFEVLNNKRNQDKYGKDVLAPKHYTIDYLFAIVMVSNPLFWMEMHGLCEDDKLSLRRIISVYKRVRMDIYKAETLPIGEMPDGTSFTGFQIKVNNTWGYLLLFREYTEFGNYEYSLYDIKGKNIKIDVLYSNRDAKEFSISYCPSNNSNLKVEFKKRRSFVFARYSLT